MRYYQASVRRVCIMRAYSQWVEVLYQSRVRRTAEMPTEAELHRSALPAARISWPSARTSVSRLARAGWLARSAMVVVS